MPGEFIIHPESLIRSNVPSEISFRNNSQVLKKGENGCSSSFSRLGIAGFGQQSGTTIQASLEELDLIYQRKDRILDFVVYQKRIRNLLDLRVM
jgi:hypothetical protein